MNTKRNIWKTIAFALLLTVTGTAWGAVDLTDRGPLWHWFTPTNACAGQSVRVVIHIYNAGTTASGGFWLRTYLSANTIITTVDHEIGSQFYPTLGARSYGEFSRLITIPGSIPPGTYYVGWILDGDHRVAESDESNNRGYIQGFRLMITNAPPSRPTGLSPLNGGTGISRTPTLRATRYYDPNGDAQQAHEWQIDTRSTFSSAYGMFSRSAGSEISISTLRPLNPNARYYWRVRYQDSRGAWSEWSVAQSFTTGGSEALTPPATPSCLSPADRSIGVSLTPELRGSVYFHPAGRPQASSVWQVALDEAFASVRYTRTLSSGVMNRLPVPAGVLSGGTRYYWRMQYRDSAGAVSGWSAPRSFVTARSASSGADFTVTRVTASPYPPRAGQSFTLYVTVQNRGTASGDAGRLLIYQHHPEEARCGETPTGVVTVGTLRAGESRQLVVTGSRVRVDAAGSYTARFFVDGNCETVETDEGNNQYTRNYRVE